MVHKYANPQKQELMEKILLHLADCADFGLSYRFKKTFGISGKDIRSLIKKNGEKDFNESITDLKKLQFIERKKNYDGSVLISLTEKGKLRALNISFKRLSNKNEKWDGRWRIIAFDIPETYKKGRNALRYRMRIAGFYELQKSLFLYPFDCKKEISDFIELFKLEKFVCLILADYIDNQERMEGMFKLKK